MTGIAVGSTGTFIAAPVDKNGNPAKLPAGVVPVWAASDTSVTITTTADGLGATVAVPAADVSTSFTLTVTATLPDTTTPSGTLVVPLVHLEVAAFTITQTA